MTIDEVTNKLTFELVTQTGHLEDREICWQYIRYALIIGIEHFTKEMKEVIALDKLGNEVGRYKGVREASVKLKISRGNIYQVLEEKRHTAGGLIFVKNKDWNYKS